VDSPAAFPSTVGAACRGDDRAYATLFGRNLPVLVGYLRRRMGGAIAKAESPEDLAQSVCREVLADLPQLEFRREDEFRAYLFLQARRKLLDRARYYHVDVRDPGKRIDLAGGVDPEAGGPTPSRIAAGKEELLLAEQAMQKLPEDQREALVLSRVAGLSYAEIAALKGVSESAVRGLVARGLSRLSGIAARQGLLPPAPGDPSPAGP
jgi:RNA polymerase sigma factor (sigma-70 family)